MATKIWKKVNRTFAFSHPQENNKVFKKSRTAELISKLDFSLTQHGNDTQHPIESLLALRPFLKYFQIFGFFPISINSENTGVWLNKRSAAWLLTLISLLIQSVMTGKAVRELIVSISSHSASEEVSSANSIVYYIHTLSMTLLMLHRLHMLPYFFESCKKVEQLCIKYRNQANHKDDNLVKHTWIVFGYFVGTQILGNVLYYYSQGIL